MSGAEHAIPRCRIFRISAMCLRRPCGGQAQGGKESTPGGITLLTVLGCYKYCGTMVPTGAVPENSLLNTSEVSRLLGIASRTVCLWAECGELPGTKLGRQWRFRHEDIDVWLRSKRACDSPLGTKTEVVRPHHQESSRARVDTGFATKN